MKEFKKIIYNLTVISIIALIFVFGLQMRPKARLESEDEIIARLQKENEDNPESTNYLITDEYISNVLPGTTVENLKKNIKEVVKVYENEGKESEIKTGKVKTGMVIEYVDNLRTYGLSVLGDIDRDGSLNQIELTREIRDIEKTEGWNISEKIDIYSGDMNRNGKIDKDDVESIIEYIVYGKLETNKFATILKPEIKVTSGNFKVDRYDSNVEIEVTQKDENGQRTVYKVTDSNESEDGQYIEIENRESVKIEKDGIYKITAYTYGAEGNKSKGETVIIVREKPTYTVKYSAGEHGKFEPQITNKLYIGDDTPEFEGEIEGNEGYKFVGWSEEIDKTVKGNKEYIAMWEPIEYTIEYDLDGGKIEGINPTKYTIESTNITLNNPTKEGYKFLGWKEEKEEKINEIVTIEKGSTENRKYTAKWKGVTGVPYKVKTYIMDTTGKYKETVVEYRGETDEIINVDTTAEEGFTYEDKLSKPSGKIKADGSTELEIYFSRNQYTIKVIAGKGIGEVKVNKENGKIVEKKIYYEAEVAIEAKVEKGYTWEKYISNNKRVENLEEQELKIKMPIGDIELTAVGVINEYKIEYELEGGNLKAGESNPSKYTVETEKIILVNPNKYGYNFIGWTGSNGTEAEEVVAIEKGSIGNRAYKANWEGAEGTEYTVKTYIMNVDGEYEETVEKRTGKTDEVIELNPKAEKGFTYEENISIPRGKVLVDGSTVLKLYFSRNKYSVKLESEAGIEKVEGAKEYYYGSEVIINAKAKDGYVWNSWKNDGQEVSKDQNYTFSMPAENVELIAKADAVEYTINYELNGGEVRTENPVNYTVETESFTLNKPEKLGYTFIGWTGSNGETAEKEVTIEKGSTGNKEYIANWKTNTDTPYKISIYKMNVEGIYEKTTTDYKGTTGEKVVAEVETENGFTYEEELSTKEGIINGDGSTELEIYFSRNKYSVELIAGKGIEKVEGEKEYYYEAEVIINAKVKDGYEWNSWENNGQEASKEQNYTFGMPAENVQLTAKAEAIEYTINYELNGGEVKIENPESYTTETESFMLNNPEKLGYTFIGWTGSNGETAEREVTIEKGSTGNKEYTANWEINTYLISYELNGGEVKTENPVNYTVETESFTLNNPEKLGYTFIGWTGSNGETAEKEVIIEKGSTGNKEYIANWKVGEYTITYDPTEGTVNPTSTVANYNEPITMPTPERKYTVSYNTNGGSNVEESIVIYGFEGWYTEKVLGEKKEYTLMPAYNETLYAHWKENSIVLGETSKKGYTFEGWYIDEELTEKVGNIGDTYTPNENITLYANWTINSYTITVHHKEDERETKIAEDETFKGNYNEEYNITDLLTNNGANERTELNADKYYYVRTEGKSEGNYEEDIEITFYYGVNTFNISGIAEEGGSISDISEEIRYGENSNKEIIITPEKGKRVANITINGIEIEFEEDENSKVVNLSKFENVIEDKEIVVTFEDIIMVVRIVSSPNEELVGTEYDSLKKALNILNDMGLNEESGETTIKIISTIEDESNVVENQNVIIDLAGNTVTSLQNTATISVKRAKLKIIDSANDGGKITNTQTVGIEVQEEGTLTLGEDDGNVWQTTPTIEGVNYGVNNKGRFNYYDGVIIGKIAINGTVQDLPYLKNPGITNEEGKQVATLATILDAEATIGKKTFTQLELAIEYANEKIGQDGSQVEIVIVKDLTKENEVTIDSSKNIKLNLNGYTTTFNANLVNNGKVEIIDELVTELGTERNGVMSFPANKLLNNENAIITLKNGIITGSIGGTDKTFESLVINNGRIVVDGGTITSDGKYSYTIKNEKNGEITLNEGNIASAANSNHSIYNIGNVTVNGGTITSSNSTGIYNVEEGNITMNAGTITAYCGIYNTSKGNVTITGGNINASYGIDNRNTGKVEVSNAVIKVTNAYYGIYNYSNGEINLENVNISSNYYGACGVYNRINGKITVTESKIDIAIGGNYSSRAIENYGVGTIILNNSTIKARNGVENNSSGTITIENSTVENSDYGISNSRGIVTVIETTINAYKGGIYNNNIGNVIATDVDIIQTSTGGSSAYSYAGIYNSNNGSVLVKGGKISATSYGITNSSTGTITITNGAIINSTYYAGIYNYKTGIITIEDAKINTTSSDCRGIYNVDKGTINIGNAENEINNESPKITSANIGIDNLYGTLNFYDGTITALNDKVLIGKVTNMPENAELLITPNEDETETAILGNDEAVVKIGETSYNSLEKAIESSKDGDIIVYQKNATISNKVLVNSTKNIILDLAGNTIRMYNQIENQGNLKITDSSKTEETKGTGTLKTYGISGIINSESGNLTIEKATILNNISGTSNSTYVCLIQNYGEIKIVDATLNTTGKYNFAINNNNTGNLTMEGGTITSSGENSDGIWNYGTLLIKSGTITACDRAIFNRESGNLTIEGATINATGKNGIGINQSSTEPIVITDGNINSKYYGIYNNTTGKIEILGGTITANYGIYNKNTGEVKVDGTQITSNPESSNERYGIYNYSTGIITLADATITISSNSYSCGIYNNSTGNITIDSIALTVTNTASYRHCTGIYNEAGEIVLKSGTIDVLHKDASNNTNYHAYGIYNDGNGTVTIGENGGEVSTSLPRITATGTTNSYGIYNTKGILNFYDGIVTGTEGYAIYNLISAQEEGYEVIKEINGDGTESATLQKLAIAQIVSTGEKYYNLQDAIDKVGDNKETVQMLRDATLSSTTETVVINENKNVVIDLNGKTIEVGNINTIQNNGTLEIVDSSKTEDIEGTGMFVNTAAGTDDGYKTLITNNGEMKLTEGTLKITGDYGRVILNNAGATLEVNGGKIISSVDRQCFGIYNLGTANVNGGKINSEVNLGNANDCSYGISTEGEGSLTITAGEITVSSSGGYYGGIYRYSTISKAININSTGATKIMGGTINVTNGSYSYAVINKSTGELTIKDTNIIIQTKISNGYGVYNSSTGNISMENTTIEANYGIYNNNIGNIEILDSVVTASYGIYNNSAGEIEILGGEITAEYGIYNRNTGKVKVERNQITSKSGNSGSRYGIYNYSTGMITLKDVNITLSSYSVYGIYNNSSGDIIIDNISLIVTNNSNSYCTGIYNEAGEIVLKSGTIDVAHKDTGNNTNYHAYGIYNDGTGTVTIGEIGGEVSTSLPRITATGTTNSYGIYNTKGILNFYDGIVTGTEGYAIYNLISDQEEGYEVIKEINEDGTESATLQKLEIAQIVSTGKKYYHLQDAIDEIGDNKETVQILRNASLSATTEKLVINENKNVVIDLNGKTVEVGNINTIQNDGTLEIIDSSKTEENEAKGAFINVAPGTKDEYKTLITNNGEMKLTEGTLKITGDYGRVILNNAGATLEVNGGKIISSVDRQCFGIYNLGTANVNGGKINSEVNLGNANDCSYGISTEGEGSLTITAGEITVSSSGGYYGGIYRYSTISKAININSTGATKIMGETINVTNGSYSYAVINNNTGELTIKDTNIIIQTKITNCYGVYNANIGNISMENTTIEANYGIYNNNIGTIEILDGVITGSYGIYNNSTGKIAVKGGVVTSNYYGIYNNRSGTISIEDANITVTSTSNDAYGIENYETGEIVLKSGIVQATYSGTGSYKAYGIHNRSTGTITIGIKDKNVKNDILTVQGATNGLYINNSNANINFYDGTIIGNIKAIYGEIDEVEEGYELNITENETKATLKVKDATVESVASVGNIYYDTIQEAINAIESEGTIQIHKEIEQNTQIVIETGKNITIDMQAHGIVYDKAEPVIVIENGATLSIIDTYEDGTDETIYGQIQNTAGVAIKNQGILYIGIDDSEVYRNSPRIEGTKAIENMGELHIYDGTITGGITGTGTTEDKR